MRVSFLSYIHILTQNELYIFVSLLFTLMSETSAFLTLLLVAISKSVCSATPPIENGQILSKLPLPLSPEPEIPKFLLASPVSIPSVDTKTNKDVIYGLKMTLGAIIGIAVAVFAVVVILCICACCCCGCAIFSCFGDVASCLSLDL